MTESFRKTLLKGIPTGASILLLKCELLGTNYHSYISIPGFDFHCPIANLSYTGNSIHVKSVQVKKKLFYSILKLRLRQGSKADL